VKTKSLATWSRLYSIELKYNITIVEFRQKLINYYTFYAVFLGVLLGAHFLRLPIFVITLLVLLFTGKAIFKVINNYSNIGNFVIDNDGKCVFSEHQEFQLDASSRVGWFGCWLVLTSFVVSNNKEVKYLFLFKNSISSQDYSRMSRIIKRLKHGIKKTKRKSI
jgi:hypothetical protein